MPAKHKALATSGAVALRAREKPQEFDSHGRHRWYNFVLGFSDKLVGSVVEMLQLQPNDTVLDPFCGTGTTLVEAMKRGIRSVGIDASPFSCFVTRVKTDRTLEAVSLLVTYAEVAAEYPRIDRASCTRMPAYRYLKDSGMIERGWIGEAAVKDALALKKAIHRVSPNAAHRNALLLAAASDLSTKVGNMKYGPEIYCGPPRRRADMWGVFSRNVTRMIQDIEGDPVMPLAKADVIKGDARETSRLLHRRGIKKVHAVISSPPYPAEHDYTRNTRMELAYLDFVESADCVRTIKQAMIRSHTKGIYRSDNDRAHVESVIAIEKLAAKVEKNSSGKTHGFARLYSTVVREYFGGMKRHLESVAEVLVPNGRYAIVVGDQASYLGTHVKTADLLGQLAEECGFKVENSFVWRTRVSSTGSRDINEYALILRRKPE